MKKVTLTIVLLALLAVCCMGIAACAPKEHDHVVTEWQVTTPASCTADGVKQGTCTICGETVEEKIGSLGHNEIVTPGYDATCTEPGKKDRIFCDRCQTLLQNDDVIGPLGHEYGPLHHVLDGETHKHVQTCIRGCGDDIASLCQFDQNVVPPTCETEGFTEYVCKTCQYEYVDESSILPEKGHDYSVPVFDENTKTHKQVCQNDPEHVLVTPCTFVDSKVAPDCTEQGYDEHVCSVCQGKYRDNYVKENGHTYNDWVTDTQPDCKTEGTKHRDCIHGDHTENGTIDKTDHNWSGWNVETAPSCKTEGFQYKECTICGDRERQSLGTLPHSYGDWRTTKDPTCTEEGIQTRTCSECSAEETSSLSKAPHTEVDMPEVQPTCLEAGQKGGKKCSVCQQVTTVPQEIAALGHDWEDTYYANVGQHTHYRYCKRNHEHVDTQGCAVTEKIIAPTCDAPGYTEYTCKDCKDTYTGNRTAQLQHILSAWVENPIEGGEGTGEHTHTHTQRCLRDNCSYTDTQPCVMSEVEKFDANCTMYAFTRYSCDECGSIHEVVTSEALGHSLEAISLANTNPALHYQKCTRCSYQSSVSRCSINFTSHDPTCEEDGYTDGICSVCKRQVTDPAKIPALGHDWSGWTYDGDNPQSDEQHTHSRKCQRTGCEESQTEPCHMVSTDSLPTCLEPGVRRTACSECKTSFENNIAEKLDHAYGPWQIDEQTGDHYRVCQNNPEHVERGDHDYEQTITPENCTEPRKITKVCSDCHYQTVEIDENTPATGHSWKDWEITATDHKSQCLTCGLESNGNHDFANSNLCADCHYDGLTYERQGAHYIVTDDKGVATSKNIVIPAYHSALGAEENLPVVSIAKNAFMNNRYVETVVLPETLKEIAEYAFNFNANLKEVSINGDTAALEKIGDYAFSYCSLLKSFEAPETLKSIGISAFAKCTALSEISVNDDIESIGANAFSETAYLNDDANWTGNLLYIGKHLIKARLVAADGSVGGVIEVEQDTVSINTSAFENLHFTGVVLPNSLKIIEANVFKGCEKLTSVEFKGSLADWLNIQFVNEYSSPLYYATELRLDFAHDRVVIPNGITKIPSGTFRGTEITEAIIPSTVTYIGDYAFADCESLSAIDIPDSVTYIGKDVLKGSLYYNTPSNWNDDGVLYVKNHLIEANPEKMNGEYEVAPGTKTIGINAFANCASLKKVTIADSVIRIGAGAFANSGVTQVVFADLDAEWKAVGQIIRVLDKRLLQYPDVAANQFKVYPGEWTVWN